MLPDQHQSCERPWPRRPEVHSVRRWLGTMDKCCTNGVIVHRGFATLAVMDSGTQRSEAPLYNTAAVVQRTGVAATTFRAWERRYGYPKPQRDAKGQRLYSERDIQGIAWLSEQTSHGVAISRAVVILRGGYAAPGTASAPAPSAAIRSFAALRAELLDALLAFDLAPAERLLAEAFALFSIEDVCMHILEPLLVEVGDRWHAGELSVADEHHITSFIRARLFSLLTAYQRADGGPLVFAACAPDEWHEIGILLVSVFLARRGIDVRYFGPNLPLDDLATVVRHHRPAVVALSAQSRETASNLRGADLVLRGAKPPHPRLVFGGQAFDADPALREAIGGTYVGPTAVAASGFIEGMLEGGTAGLQAAQAESAGPPARLPSVRPRRR
jgi:MerR family transcriptional regulator, light-induced transcriptional regulator